ncbi:hypothetical protein JD844_017457 [Phrynosoma platyrhinos]|uniref:Zinc finger protein 281 n=1 Tax=Phrynosoma platyrhinos TaxID=52577 RepID=A0ABQ7SLV1_PHRPL|nr:hypothetical protein JD844_017457 [Phrynosoma platyrhinos]
MCGGGGGEEEEEAWLGRVGPERSKSSRRRRQGGRKGNREGCSAEERASERARSPWGFFHSLVNIKQEKPSDQEEEDHHHHHHHLHHHYGGLFGIAGEERHPTLGGPGGGGGGGGAGGGGGVEGSVIQDLSLFHHLHHHPHRGDLLLGLRSGGEAGPEEPKPDPQARKAKRPKSETQGTKAKRKPAALSSRPLVAAGEGEAAMLAANQKPHGNTGSSRRKSKAKCISTENKEHKPSHKVSDAQMASNMTLQNYAVEFPIVSSSGGLIGPGIEELQKKVPKLVFKKGNRKGTDKSFLNYVSPLPDLLGQKPLSGKPGGSLGIVTNTSVDAIGLLQAASGKPGQLNSNYDDAMQFSKKRRYLQTASSNSAFSINVGHMASQPSVIQSAGVSVMDSETPLSLIDSSSLNADIKSCQDKSGIPDEVLQSLLEQYSHKSEGQKEDPFSITEQRVDLHASGEHSEMVQEDNLSPSPQTSSNDKTSMLQEYSKYLQHAFERTTNSAGFAFGPSFQFVSLSSSLHNHSLFQDKQIYTTSPLECGFSQSVTSVLPSALSKPPFGMLLGSQPGFYLSALEATHQQLTPSQELDDLIDSQKSVDTSSGYQSTPQKLNSQKEQKSLESSTSFPIPSQELANQIDPQKDLEHRATYQIETFAQAFGSQFKTGSRVPMTFIANSNGEVDHRVRTSVSDFSGYTNIMSDVNDDTHSRLVG